MLAPPWALQVACALLLAWLVVEVGIIRRITGNEATMMFVLVNARLTTERSRDRGGRLATCRL